MENCLINFHSDYHKIFSYNDSDVMQILSKLNILILFFISFFTFNRFMQHMIDLSINEINVHYLGHSKVF